MQLGNRTSDHPEPVDPEEIPNGTPGGRPGMPLHPFRVYRALRAGKWWLLAAALVGSALGVLIAKFVMGSTYEAGVSLKYEGALMPSDEPRVNPSEVRSLSDAFFMDAVLRTTREELGLRVPLPAMRARMEVEPDTNAGTVSVRTLADEAEGASTFANTLAEVFRNYHKERHEQQLRSEISRVERRMRAARKSLTEARETYDTFREAHGISDLSNQQERSIENAAQLQARRDLTRSDIEALKARVVQLRRDLEEAPDLEVTTAEASAEARMLNEAQAELSKARSNLAGNHPRVQALEHRVATLRIRLNADESHRRGMEALGVSNRRTVLETALTEAEADLESAQQRLTTLSELSAQAQERVASLSEIEGEASALLSQVRIHEQVLADLEEEHAQLSDLVRDPSSGFRVLSLATPPENPKRSKSKMLTAVASPIILLLLVSGTLLTRELWGGRAWTAAEVAYWGKAPVIGATGWPRDPEGLDALVADLDDFVPHSSGEMLVVGVNERSAPLAREIADCLREDWTDARMFGTGPVTPIPAPSAPPPSQTFSPPAGTSAHLVAVSSAQRVAAVPTDPDPRQATVDPQGSEEPTPQVRVRPWLGPAHGQGLRRAARLADRVLVTVPAGHVTAAELAATRTRLGRSGGVAFVVVGLPPQLAHLADRVGPVRDFWAPRQA